MSRLDRLRDYANPVSRENWRGASRDMANIDRWSERASEESDSYRHRAKGGQVQLPDTGGKVAVHDSAAPPRHDPDVDARMKAKADSNFVGSSPYMRGVRRDA